MFGLFSAIGVVVGSIRGINYFFLFSGIGMFEMNTRIFIAYFPKLRQALRILIQGIIGLFFIFWLGMAKGVNFQFPQISFDFYNGIITGAVIQMVVSRLLLPFIFGNAFCSRACWAGFFFELTNKTQFVKNPVKRSDTIAYGYMFFLIALAIYVVFFLKPLQNDDFRKNWIIVENILILTAGFFMTFVVGSRAYCRLLCPFLTLSSTIAPYSLFKIAPVNASSCVNCKKCNNGCPMLIDVHGYVVKNKSVNHKICIVCERCVSNCNSKVLKLSSKFFKK
jgi:polyferredoxin